MDGKETVVLERELPCEIEDIAECLASFSHPIERLGFEAGTISQHLFYGRIKLVEAFTETANIVV